MPSVPLIISWVFLTAGAAPTVAPPAVPAAPAVRGPPALAKPGEEHAAPTAKAPEAPSPKISKTTLPPKPVEAPKPPEAVAAPKPAEAPKPPAAPKSPSSEPATPPAAAAKAEEHPVPARDSKIPKATTHLSSSIDADVSNDKQANPLAPSLSRKGLCDDFKRTAKEHAAALKRIQEERRGLVTERIRLEELSDTIARQRDLLRAETLRLEEMMRLTRGSPPTNGPASGPATAARGTGTGAKPSPAGLEDLAKTVKAMKPEVAASLVERLDANLSAQLLRRMRPADAGAVMDRLRPELAAQLIADMATLPAQPKKSP